VGGFIYMASCLFFVGASLAILSWPMKMHFEQRFGRGGWNWPGAAGAAGAWLLLNAVALTAPWRLGREALQRHEE
jgi:hypothetical protein